MNYDRIRNTLDVERMQQSHVTIVGGAYGLARDLVHSGLGELTYIDFDRIDASNRRGRTSIRPTWVGTKPKRWRRRSSD